MNGIITLAVRRPITIIMIFLGLALFGVISAFNLGIDFLPDITVPRLVISTTYQGLPPEQIRELISIPLEDALTSLKGIKKISSISREGISSIEIEFHWGTDMDLSAVEAREIIDTAYAILPAEASKPLVLPVNPGEIPVLTLALFPVDGDMALARRLAEREIKTKLQQVEGVGSVVLVGGRTREVKIKVDQALIAAKGITLDQITSVLQQSNLDFPAGSYTEGITEYIVKTEGKLKKSEDLGELFIQDRQGALIKLKNMAAIEMEEKERRSLFYVDGKEAVGLIVYRKGGTSPVNLSRNVNESLGQIKQSYAADLVISLVKDSSLFIASSIRDLVFSALSGAAIAFLVLILFLRNLRISLILITSIPFSILTALLLLNLAGKSINIMSLGGLALGIGMLVDNSVVVLENLQKHLPILKQSKEEYVIRYTSMMAGSTFGSTITSLIVFVPIIFLPGIIGALFTDLAVSVAFSLLASYLVSVTLVPVLFSLTYKHKETKKKERMEVHYRKILALMIRRPWIAVVMVLLLFVPGIIAFMNINIEFMPDVDQKEVEVTVILPPGTSMEYTARVSRELAEQVMKQPQVESLFSRAGGEENDTYYLADPESTREIIYMTVKMKKNSTVRTKTFMELLKLTLFIDEAVILVNLPGNIITPLLGIKSGEFLYNIEGDTPSIAAKRGEEVLEKLINTKTAAQLTLIPSGKKPQIRLTPDRDYIAKAGTTLARTAQTLGAAITGTTATKLTIDGKDYDVRVLLQEKDRSTLEKLELLKIETAQGNRIFLKDLATLTRVEGTPSLLREDRKDITVVKASCNISDQNAVQQLLSRQIAGLPYVRSAETSELNRNLEKIILIFTLVLLLLFLVLGAQFESFLLPLFLMLSLPLSFSGIFTALWITGESLNLNSTLGILVLLGIVVNNSIVLFENYKHKIDHSGKVLISIYRGSSERIRPILITMFTTIMALLPIAVDITGTQAQSSMAVAIIGGLFISTTLTLVVSPILFLGYFKRKAGKHR